MAQKENIYRVGFGRIRLGFDQNVTASEGLTPEQVNNMIAAQVPNITFNNGGGTVPFATLNGQTYYFPPTPKTYDSVYPIKRTPGQSTDTFSLMYDTDTLGVQNNKLYAKAKPVTYELPLKEENGVVKVIVGNSMTKTSGSLNVKVSENDSLLSVDGNGLKTTISIDGPNDVEGYRVYTIKGKANVSIGTISFPIQEFTDTKIDTLSFDTSTKKLTIVDTAGSTFETTVPYKDYVQGDGININGSIISVKYDGTTIVKDSTTGNLKSVFSIANNAPIVVSNGNTVGLNYNSNQFEVSEGALNIKDGIIPDLSNLESSITTIQGDITTINTTLGNKANATDLNGKLDIAQPNITADYYLVVKEVNGEKKITFQPFPLDSEEIDNFKNMENVLVYKGVKSSISELPAIAESEVGDVWFVNIGTQNEPKYTEYVSNGDVWEKLGDHEPVVYTGGTNITVNGTTISCDIDTTDFVQTSSMDNYYTKTQTDNKFLTITDAASTYLTGPAYTAGTNVTISNGREISVNIDNAINSQLQNYYTKSETYSQTEVDNMINAIEDHDTTYTAGTGIDITNGVITCTVTDTDTTYSGDGTTVFIDSNNVISANIPAVPDMTNYYTKSQTYNKTEVGNLISGIIDNELSPTSEHALQNKVLYNELRITEGVSSQTLKIFQDGTLTTELPIIEYDANTLSQTQDEHYQIPGTPKNCAISVTNCAGKSFYFNGDPVDDGAVFALKMDAECPVGGYAYGMPEDLVNKWLVIPDWSVENFGGENYGFEGDLDDNDEGVTTEVSGGSTVKSLKTKIAELEARIAAVEEWIEH